MTTTRRVQPCIPIVESCVVVVSTLVGMVSPGISAIWELLTRTLECARILRRSHALPYQEVLKLNPENFAVNNALYPLSSLTLSSPEHDSSVVHLEMFCECRMLQVVKIHERFLLNRASTDESLSSGETSKNHLFWRDPCNLDSSSLFAISFFVYSTIVGHSSGGSLILKIWNLVVTIDSSESAPSLSAFHPMIVQRVSTLVHVCLITPTCFIGARHGLLLLLFERCTSR